MKRGVRWLMVIASGMGLLLFPWWAHGGLCRVGNQADLALLRAFCGHNLPMGMALYYALIALGGGALGVATLWWKARPAPGQ
jgi:hypothetical protein